MGEEDSTEEQVEEVFPLAELIKVCLRTTFYWHFAPICTEIALGGAASTKRCAAFAHVGHINGR